MIGRSRKQVLVARLGDELYRRVADQLRKTDTDVHRASWDEATVELVQSIPFDAIVIGFPVSTEALARFLESARADGSACRRAGLVLITEPDHGDEARDLIGKGANRVVTTDKLESELALVLEDLSQPAPRLSVKAPARIKLFADGRPLRIMAQIENLSTSGMLLRGVTQFPIGTPFDFEITIPGENAAIRGRAEITRATNPAHESVKGVGVRFVSLMGSDRVRLEMYLDRELA